VGGVLVLPKESAHNIEDGLLFDNATGSLTSNAVNQYEETKERIAVSYLASVERSRLRGRSELRRILEEAALRIQCMWRTNKAKGVVEGKIRLGAKDSWSDATAKITYRIPRITNNLRSLPSSQMSS